MRVVRWRAALAALLLGGCITQPYPTDPGDRLAAPGTAQGWSEGQKLYEAACARCHGSDGRGIAGAGVNLVGIDATNAQLQAQIRSGKTGHMPAKGGYPMMTEQQLKLLVAYLEKLADNPRSAEGR